MDAARKLAKTVRDFRIVRERLERALKRSTLNREELENIMTTLDEATADLGTAVAANTTATNNLIAAYNSAAPTPARPAATAVLANNMFLRLIIQIPVHFKFSFKPVSQVL